MSYTLQSSPRTDKKFRVTTPSGKNIDFGAAGYSDYPTHKDDARMRNYLSRHEAREDWSASGINSAGFWARWILWNEPDLMDSIRDTERRFNIKINFISNSSLPPAPKPSISQTGFSLPPVPSLSISRPIIPSPTIPVPGPIIPSYQILPVPKSTIPSPSYQILPVPKPTIPSLPRLPSRY